jgi:DNA-binding XRE family transcriptional regulator
MHNEENTCIVAGVGLSSIHACKFASTRRKIQRLAVQRPMKYGSEIRRIRLMKEIPQGVLAKKVKISPVSLARIESGDRNASRATLNRILKALGYQITEIIAPLPGKT